MKIGFVSCFDYFNHGKFEEFGFEKAYSFLDFDLLLWNIGFLHFGYHGKSGFRKLLKDRHRRVNELRIFLESGRTLIVLLSDINDLKHRMSKNLDEYRSLLTEDGLSPESFDMFSFLPVGLEKTIRDSVVESRGKRIDFKGDRALFPAWKAFYKAAWYDTYFTRVIGTPFLFVSGTQLPVGTWLSYLNGNVFFIPSTEYDTNDDYPEFVEAAIHLTSGLNELTGRQIEVSWQEIANNSLDDRELESIEVSSNAIRLIPTSMRSLRIKIKELFDNGELKNLCFDLNIRYEDVSISGGKPSETVREIVRFCQRNGILDQLIAYCQEERPNEDWSEFI